MTEFPEHSGLGVHLTDPVPVFQIGNIYPCIYGTQDKNVVIMTEQHLHIKDFGMCFHVYKVQKGNKKADGSGVYLSQRALIRGIPDWKFVSSGAATAKKTPSYLVPKLQRVP